MSKIGMIDDTTQQHVFQTRHVANTVAPKHEFAYYGLTTNGNPVQMASVINSGPDQVEQAIAQTVVKTFNSAADGINTLKKDCKAINVSSGVNTARLIKTLAESNQAVSLNGDYKTAAAIVHQALDKYKADVDKAKGFYEKTVEQFDGVVVTACGNERGFTDHRDPDAAKNMLSVNNTINVASARDVEQIEQYSSPGSNITFTAPGTTGLTDEKGQQVQGTSFAAPRVTAVFAHLLDQGMDKKTAINEVAKHRQQSQNVAQRDGGFGHLAIAPQLA
jgi:subtilisin family serine protease